MTKQKQKKQLILNAFLTGSPLGTWQNPEDQSREFTRSLDAWVELAKLAERGKLNSIFIADHLSFFDDYKGPGNWQEAVKTGMYAPRIDPGATLAALATQTESIGFGITFSTVVEHPYHFARRLASLDHLTKGRVGWNIVSSYLNSIGPQLLNGEPFPEHDERYVKTAEYLDVVYDLLLSSWRDDALVYDKKNGVFANPDAIRKINHDGKYFKVAGPAITEPTTQRIPLLIQAGTSEKGKVFAAENAEIIFVGRGKDLRATIAYIKRLAQERFGRDPNDIKFITTAHPIIGRTHEEALEKLAKQKRYVDIEAEQVAFGGVTGIDLSKFELDDVVEYRKSNNIRSIVDNIYKDPATGKPKKGRTKREILESYGKIGQFVGSAEEVADQIEEAIERDDLDGFNLGLIPNYPNDLIDIVELLVPELQRRGLFWKDYAVPGGTFRENVYGVKGKTFFPESHPAHNLRWTSEHSREEFDELVNVHKSELRSKRKLASLASYSAK